MLRYLAIDNFALIDHVEIELGSGLNVLTGETGAGKSILLAAVQLVLGGRASADVVRNPDLPAQVQGIFDIGTDVREHIDAMLADAGLPSAGDELIVRRHVPASGRGRVYINDTVSTVGSLQTIIGSAVEIIGQHQHLSLLRPGAHRDLIDQFGDYDDLRTQMRTAAQDVKEAQTALNELQTAAANRSERTEFLAYQLREIDAVGLRDGEMDELDARLSRARNASKLMSAYSDTDRLLQRGGSSAVNQLAAAQIALRRIINLDPAAQALETRVDEITIVLEDLARDVQAAASDLDHPAGLDSMESRHQELRKLTRKYVTDEAGLIERAETMRVELDTLQNYDKSLEKSQARCDQARAEAIKVGRQLMQARQSAATEMFAIIVEVLDRLAMNGTRFELRSEERELLSADGIEELEILFSPNPGEDLRSMSRVASGGELSRIMLAIKTALDRKDSVQTYVFDEVDTGIGGTTADVVGHLIAEVADRRQILCVTHLPQIAVFAQRHFHVSKSVIDERTISAIDRLSEDERVHEVARMAGGTDLSEASLAHAQELLDRAQSREV